MKNEKTVMLSSEKQIKRYKVMVEVIKLGYVIVEVEDEFAAIEDAQGKIFTEVDFKCNTGNDIRWHMDGPSVRELLLNEDGKYIDPYTGDCYVDDDVPF